MDPLEWWIVALVEAAALAHFNAEFQRLGRFPYWPAFSTWRFCEEREAWLGEVGLSWRGMPLC